MMTPDFSAKARELCNPDPPHVNRCMAKPPCVGCYRCEKIAAALREVHDAAIDGCENAMARACNFSCPACGSEPWCNIDCAVCAVFGALKSNGGGA
jgi:hypothetical protein